ncbi:Protein sister of odd and bowel [Holothuria leucospilota]|uniref:Protein sister of odd and bowel n=1 Tax=Holothuria leucospilota TaxID=206669 RepID=A0A9Q1H466_HOLLE|nr:Protein sister of odd and bowel [Holothuria leucospilota]
MKWKWTKTFFFATFHLPNFVPQKVNFLPTFEAVPFVFLSIGADRLQNIPPETDEDRKRTRCKFCNRQFTLAPTRRRHELIHLGIKPFGCNYCSKRFYRTDHLKLHEKTHEIRPRKPRKNTCPKCGTGGFSDLHGLYIHLMAEHVE